MKVVFVTREGYELAGARVRCYHFARELNRQGIEASVLSFADDLGAEQGELELIMPFRRRVELNRKAFLELRKEGRETVFVLQRLNYHIMAPVLAALLHRNLILLDVDDWNIREDPVYHFGFIPSSKMEFLTRILARQVKACIAASGFLVRYLSQFNAKTHYIPTGVDTELFSPKRKDMGSAVVFSWIGTVYHADMAENVRFILSCFSELADCYENIFLSLAGQGAYFDIIKNEAVSPDLKSRVIFQEWITPDRVPEYLDSVDVGLLPLIQSTKFNMAKSPTKLFEYMSMARPTISSDIGEAGRIVKDGETGLLASGRDGFISAMRRLIEDCQLRSTLGANARLLVEREYSLRMLGARLADILRETKADQR